MAKGKKGGVKKSVLKAGYKKVKTYDNQAAKLMNQLYADITTLNNKYYYGGNSGKNCYDYINEKYQKMYDEVVALSNANLQLNGYIACMKDL